MTIVRSYKGIGALLVGEGRLENVNYRLDVFQIRHRLDGRGLLTAESESLSDAALEEAFSRGGQNSSWTVEILSRLFLAN